MNLDAIAKDYPSVDKRTLEVAAKLLGEVVTAESKDLNLSVDGNVMRLSRGNHFHSNATDHLAAVLKMI